ncbi:Potassium voltage-gated channel subfamily KQT; possible potassium channel, VIC family [uncultured Synechococcales cyanobacterium]|uniref:Potassium voltage-gated channel subfamily KQT possible potassium channel, VIC family n=1 Tax=uncultured Synechococcales cyanobacterium TaxID=1936017 RepID=A0A6J4UY63_9CYAN|nr:Potassium voltage-gated channel subfamily KQT; possible potassium channel, VIC family [uncultured Synechococcales cyanobacterium]
MNNLNVPAKQALNKERWEILQQLEDWLDGPMLVLGFVWLVLLVIELIWGLTPLFEVVATAIWIIFILNFILEFTLAPDKVTYLKRNWLTVISLVLPALRVLRIARVLRLLRATRGLRLVRIISSLNRGMRTLRASLGRRGFGYIVVLTLVVVLVGAAGMYAFESDTPDGLNDYGTALWWTAMLITTLGSEYWPQTPEGRVLCFILALYAFAVFGYLTAAIATFFIGRDAENEEAELAGDQSIKALHAEIAAMRADIHILCQKSES